MSLNIVKNLVPESKYYLKCPYSMTPTRIVVHNTANDASARNEITYMRNNEYETSFHYAVDDKEIVQGIPEDRNAWHASDGNGVGNREGIAIEICYSLSGGERFNKAEDNAALLIADILKRYGWGVDKVTKHQDYTDKYCPHRTLDLGWNRFIEKIENVLNHEKYPLLLDVPVYMSSKEAMERKNPVKTYAKGDYYIFNEANGMLNISKNSNQAGGWINPEDNVVKESKEDTPTIPEDEDNEYYERIEANNPLLWFIDSLVKLLTELLGRLKKK